MVASKPSVCFQGASVRMGLHQRNTMALELHGVQRHDLESRGPWVFDFGKGSCRCTLQLQPRIAARLSWQEQAASAAFCPEGKAQGRTELAGFRV